MKRQAEKIFINSVSSYARMGIGMVLSLVITRLSLNTLSSDPREAKELLGVFALLMSLTATTQFLNESTQKALVRFLSISFHRNDKDEIARIFNSGWVMNATIGILISLGVFIICPWVISSLNIPVGYTYQAKVVVYLLACTQLINACFQPWGASLAARDLYLLTNSLEVLKQLLIVLGILTISVTTIDPLIGLGLAWLLPGLAVGIALSVSIAYSDPNLKLNLKKVNLEDFKRLFSLGGWSSLLSFSSNLYERTDQILINLFLGPLFNAAYTVVIQLGNSSLRLVTALTNVLLPTASRLQDNGSQWERQQIIIKTTKYVLSVALPCALTICVFRREIIDLWLGESFEEATRVLPLATFLVFCRIPILVTKPYLTAANKLKLPALAMLLDGIINVILSIIFVKYWNLGLAGILLGTLSTNVIRFFFFQIPYVCKIVNLPVLKYWKEAYFKPALGMVWLLPFLILIHQYNFVPLERLIYLIILGATYCTWIRLAVFETYERKLFGNIAFRLLKK